MNVREVVDGLAEGQVHKCASCLKAVECNVSEGSTLYARGCGVWGGIAKGTEDKQRRSRKRTH